MNATTTDASWTLRCDPGATWAGRMISPDVGCDEAETTERARKREAGRKVLAGRKPPHGTSRRSALMVRPWRMWGLKGQPEASTPNRAPQGEFGAGYFPAASFPATP